MEFSVQVVDSEQILPAVLQQVADLGFSRIGVAHPQVTCVKLYEDPVVLIAPRDEFDFEGPARGVQDLLQQYPLFTHHHPEYWTELLTNLRTVIPTIRTIQVNQEYVALEWVTEKLGVSFFSLSTVRKSLLRGSVEQVPFSAFPLPTTSTYLVAPAHPTSPALQFAKYAHRFVEQRL